MRYLLGGLGFACVRTFSGTAISTTGIFVTSCDLACKLQKTHQLTLSSSTGMSLSRKQWNDNDGHVTSISRKGLAIIIRSAMQKLNKIYLKSWLFTQVPQFPMMLKPQRT